MYFIKVVFFKNPRKDKRQEMKRKNKRLQYHAKSVRIEGINCVAWARDGDGDGHRDHLHDLHWRDGHRDMLGLRHRVDGRHHQLDHRLRRTHRHRLRL